MRWRNRRKVFLAHGRWHEAVEAMKAFLGSLGVEVVDWDAARLRARREGQHATDIAGVDHVLFDGSAKSRRQFVDRLKNIGVRADTSGAAWLSAGRFPRPLPEVGAARLRTRRSRS
ncbi:hypothetical protein AB0C27_34715 [Nonomuraea sp. NPDC048882]|uniref:hypothetical protein n=1 Tax=Nonomuraea sp. NPDC048882 TaxID=3154347 RepID=UPI0033FC5DD6